MTRYAALALVLIFSAPIAARQNGSVPNSIYVGTYKGSITVLDEGTEKVIVAFPDESTRSSMPLEPSKELSSTWGTAKPEKYLLHLGLVELGWPCETE